MEKQKREIRILGIVITLIISVILFFIDSGFDLNDEGFYFIGYVSNQPIFFSLTGFHHIVRLLPFSDEIVFNRIYRLVFHFLTAIILSKALTLYFKDTVSAKTMFCWILLGNLYSYVYSPASVSYNTLNLIFIQLSLAAYLFFIVNEKKNFTVYFLFLVLISLTTINKLSSGVVVFALFAFDYWMRNQRKLITVFHVFISGIIVSLLVFSFFFFQNKDLFYILSLMARENGPFSGKQTTGFFQLKQLFWNPVYQSKKQIVFVLAYIVIYYLSRIDIANDQQKKTLSGCLYFLLTAGMLWYYIQFYACGPGTEIFTVLILALLFVLMRREGNYENFDWKIFILIFFLPLAGFFGSDVSPFEGMNHYAVFFIFLVIYLMNKVQINYDAGWSVLLGIFILIRFVYFPFENPPYPSMNKIIETGQDIEKLTVGDSVFNRNSEFNGMRALVPPSANTVYLNIPPGLLYLNKLTSFGSLYYNSEAGLNSYIALLYLIPKPDEMQYIICNKKMLPSSRESLNKYFAYCMQQKGVADTLLNQENYTVLKFRKGR